MHKYSCINVLRIGCSGMVMGKTEPMYNLHQPLNTFKCRKVIIHECPCINVLTLSTPALQSYVNCPDCVRLKFHFQKYFATMTDNCFTLYNQWKFKFFLQELARIHLQYLYNTNCPYLSNKLFHHQSTQENWTYLIIFWEIIQQIFHCNILESENLVPTKL